MDSVVVEIGRGLLINSCQYYVVVTTTERQIQWKFQETKFDFVFRELEFVCQVNKNKRQEHTAGEKGLANRERKRGDNFD